MNQKKDDFKEFLDEIRQTFEYRLEGLAGTFSDELWTAMSSAGLNQSELARKAGVSRQFLSHVFRGKPNLTLKTMQKLADAVGYTVHLHLAPAKMHCEWLHFLTEKPKQPLAFNYKDRADVLTFKKLEQSEKNEDLAIAA